MCQCCRCVQSACAGAGSCWSPACPAAAPRCAAPSQPGPCCASLLSQKPPKGHHAPAVQALLEGGARLDDTDDAGDSALHAAVRKGQAATVRALLAAGAPVDKPNKEVGVCDK